MQNDRTMLHLGGIFSVCYGGLQFVFILILLLGLKFAIVPVGETVPDNVLKLYQNESYGIALFVRLVSFIFLVPALTGMYVYLKNELNGHTRVGFLFGIIAYFIYLIANFLQAGLVQLLAFQNETASFTMKNDVFLINQIIQFLINPAIIPFLLFLLFWGFSFRKIENTRAWLAGVLFLATAGIIVLEELFTVVHYEKAAASFLALSVCTLASAYILAGIEMFQRANLHHNHIKS